LNLWIIPVYWHNHAASVTTQPYKENGQAMAKKFPKRVDHILQEARIELQNIYADRLKEIILFGSYARGDYSRESDIDLLLLLDHFIDLAAEREKYIPVVSRISLKYDTVLSVIPFDFQAYQTKKTPLILNIHKEGVSV
jgi:uncharacterized protein